MLSKPELLAPAGDLLRAKTALIYGADAVYAGGQNYSLRSRASNFSLADIQELCKFAHVRQKHVHITVNIIPHDEDFAGLKEYLEELDECGVDAVIVASPAIMELAHTYAPHIAVHGSTQMSVCNGQAALFLKENTHLDRIVLARECTLEQVQTIVQTCGMETEVFIAGGMCSNFSGRCILSNEMADRDANRGGCAHSCRWEYELTDRNGKKDALFTMGSRDLNAYRSLAELMKIGVTSLKIEGRMKSEYYIASIVSAWRSLIDELAENDGDMAEERYRYYQDLMQKAQNREIWDGFYQPFQPEDSLIAHANDNEHVSHDFIGTVLSSEENSMVIQTRNRFALGQELEVLVPGKEPVAFTPAWLQDEEGMYRETVNSPMIRIKMPVPCLFQAGDIVRIKR